VNKTIHAEASYVINAPAAPIYAVVSDYRVGHQAIVPKPYFSELIIEKGGQGAGTVIRGTLTAFGSIYPFRYLISEPKPGHVLMETDIETGQYSTFTFEPLRDGTHTRVTIASEFPRKPGFVGFMESLTIPAFTRRLYKQELENLAHYVREKMAVTTVVTGR